MTIESLFFAVFFWLLGVCICLTLVSLWFSTTLPVELCILLRNAGLMRRAAGIMPQTGGVPPASLEEFTRRDFDMWLLQLQQAGLLWRRPAHIMGCKGCFSVWASFLAGGLSLALLCLGWDLVPMDTAQLVLLWLTAPLSWPGIVCRVLHTPSTQRAS